MCGIFGQITSSKINKSEISILANQSKQRGKDSSGLVYFENFKYKVAKADFEINKLLNKIKPYHSQLVLGHSRLITNSWSDNQPIIRNNNALIHNGIIVNEEEIWSKIDQKKQLKIDSETIIAIAEDYLNKGGEIENVHKKILSLCKGIAACALTLTNKGKLLLFSNNGSLYVGKNKTGICFASEKYPLTLIECENIVQIKNEVYIINIPTVNSEIEIINYNIERRNLIPEFIFNKNEAALLNYEKLNLKRCTRCILPETMPFIKFDTAGVCNYCHHYKIRNRPKPKEELFSLVEKYRRKEGNDCIVPFSGGRDSCYGLHLIVNELKMKPITYTYDWGMVTDLGRRNISRMCAELGVENIIIADDIEKKRKNISMNLKAWLKAPHLGLIALLTAGDKHFFRHIETVKKQTGINLNLWGVNPLEVTHFKTGFLGIPPDFEESRVYSSGWSKQMQYHKRRFVSMLKSPGYFNSSLWDTLSGEYYRSFRQKQDYFHIFDYWKWDEKIIDDTLAYYNWEKAIDTNTTWRIGDGTAAFYNYVYYTVAGFTEHDTFRSNQIREGDLTREMALKLVEDENTPRYQNIRWYLDTLGMDFKEVIKVVNNIPKLYF